MTGHDCDTVPCPLCRRDTLRGMVTIYGRCSECIKREHAERVARR